MLKALTAEQARQAEGAAAAAGLSVATLMERAGEAVAREASKMASSGDILVFAGGGNNGGDGWVAARRLREDGRDVRVISLVAPETLKDEAAGAAESALRAGVEWRSWDSSPLEEPALVIDALLGFGAKGAPRGPYADAIRAIGSVGVPVISVDLPSGVDADTGTVPGDAVWATETVTFSAPKLGLVNLPGAALAGRIFVADIGVPPDAVASADAPEIWRPDEFARLLPFPMPGAHKSSRGRLVVVAGSGGMTGAAILAASAALRMGAGFVALAAPESVADIIDAAVVPAVTWPLPEGEGRAIDPRAVEPLLEAARGYDAMVLGPGIAVTEGAMEAVRAIANEFQGALLVDAGGLSAFVGELGILADRSGGTVITPHPGEMARLLGLSTAEVESNRLVHAAEISAPQTVCVLKGFRTVVAGHGRSAVNLSGNPGMATAGSGDVLSGAVGALLAQRLPLFEAAVLGVHLHGAAGDVAAEKLTGICFNAEDIRDALPAAVARLIDQVR